MKLLSIIVPVYNAEAQIENCLNSIISQTYTNWECLLIDDESTDRSGVICEKFARKDKRFRYFRKKNGGVADARNYGIERALGTYICFVDNDDVIHHRMYEILIQNLEKTKCEVSCCKYIKDYRDYSEIKYELSEEIPHKTVKIINDKEEIFYSILKGNENDGIEGFVWNKVYKKSLVKEIRFNKDVALVDDAYFSLELFDTVNNVCYIPIELYHWVQHGNNQTITGFYKQYASAAKAYLTMVDIYEKKIKKNETNEILKSQALIWNLNACDIGENEKALTKKEKRYYRSIISRYAYLSKKFDIKVKIKVKLIMYCYWGYRICVVINYSCNTPT